MSGEIITADMLESHGPIIQKLFRVKYPDGASRAELAEAAPVHGWLRRVLESLEREE